METYTFGDFDAAKILVEILEKSDSDIRKKVCGLINDYQNGLTEIKNIKNKKYRTRLSDMWRDDFLKNRICFSPEIDRFTKNVIVTYHRKFMLENQ